MMNILDATWFYMCRVDYNNRVRIYNMYKGVEIKSPEYNEDINKDL